MSLSKPAVNALQLERSLMDLWNEFLGLWFDGASHVVGSNSTVVFPMAEFLFQQTNPPQPAAAGTKQTPLSIHVVWNATGKIRRAFEATPLTGARDEWATVRGQFLFYVRCASVQNTGGNAEANCILTSDLLCGVLNNSKATQPLAEKGIHRLATTTPVPASKGTGAVGADAAKDYAARIFSASATLRYPLKSQ